MFNGYKWTIKSQWQPWKGPLWNSNGMFYSKISSISSKLVLKIIQSCQQWHILSKNIITFNGKVSIWSNFKFNKRVKSIGYRPILYLI